MLIMVPMMETGAGMQAMNLGASLRDRATLPSPLRGLGPSGGYPSRLRSLRSLRAPLAAAARCAHRRCRTGTLVAKLDGLVRRTAGFSSRRRYAPRSSDRSPRSPWPAAPAAGIASARRRCTPCLAGAGFTAHRLRHCAVHDPLRPCLRSCARSCGALPHFAPHRAGQSCPHDCGHRRPSLRQRAAHVCLRLRPHHPPLNRRGGSPPPASPASIPPSLSLGFRAVWTPVGVWFSHPTHPDAGRAMRAFIAPFLALTGSTGRARLLDLACIGAIHDNLHRPGPRLTSPAPERYTSDMHSNTRNTPTDTPLACNRLRLRRRRKTRPQRAAWLWTCAVTAVNPAPRNRRETVNLVATAEGIHRYSRGAVAPFRARSERPGGGIA